jgi:H(+)-translocating pyrophosphatase
VESVPYIAALTAVAGLVLAVYFYGVVRRASPGNARMVELMEAIQEGSRAFIRREYTWVAGFVVLMTVLIAAFLDYGRPWGAIAYISGAVLSALAGFIGMTIATLANARTAEAARSGPQLALPLAFRGGAVMGFTVAGLSLLGLAVSYLVYVEWLEVDDPFSVLTAFGLGASSIALFSRVGGGIYTKAADVGADLVGKVEAGIPEDDPRNPATIADNVGDNVGDVAGMGADLFESYSGSIIAPIALAAFIPVLAVNGVDVPITIDQVPELFLFPLAIAAVGMVASIIGAFMVKSSGSTSVHDLSKALHRGTNVAAAITVVGVIVLAFVMLDGSDAVESWWGLPISVIGGLFVGYAIGKVAEIWTSDEYRPVKKIAEQAETGPATTILGGISAGMVSVAASVVLIVIGVGVAYWGGQQAVEGLGIYGIAVAAIGMLATTGVVVSVDAYGPIADNAGGIAEMAHMPPEVREVTDSLDSLGNTTAAVAKGFAVGSAALTALALFKAFEASLAVEGHNLSLDVGVVEVFIGLFLGAMLPFLFASLTIDAVGPCRQQDDRGGAPPVPRDPGPAGGARRRRPRVRQVRRHLHHRGAARDADPGRPRRGGPPRHRVHRRRRPRRLPRRRARHRLLPRHLHGQRRRCLGQRQEVHRGGRPRRQGLRAPQGGGRRRHRGRPVQGHLGPGDEHPHQGDDDRVADLRQRLRVALPTAPGPARRTAGRGPGREGRLTGAPPHLSPCNRVEATRHRRVTRQGPHDRGLPRRRLRRRVVHRPRPRPPPQRRRRARGVQEPALGPHRHRRRQRLQAALHRPREKKEQVAKLKKLVKGASEIYLATDEDREGEAIAWHLLEVLSPNVPVRRMVFHEITRAAIERAIAEPRELDLKRVDAQETRRILDRLYGYETSPVLWKKVAPKLSAGRVQSVATRLVVERERARMRFRRASYWDVEGTFAPAGTDTTFGATLVALDGTRLATGRDFGETGELTREVLVLDEAGARDLVDDLAEASVAVRSVERRPYRRRPAAPFITSTLQQEAGRKLGMGAKQAMATAQRLYENGYITYMRTDSTTLSEGAVATARALIRERFGAAFVPDAPRTYASKVKNAQEAHEAIRPAGERFRSPEEVAREVGGAEARLYELVWQRTVASQMADAVGETVTVRLGGSGRSGRDAEFSTSGTVITFPGYQRVYVEGRDDAGDAEDAERRLPALAEGAAPRRPRPRAERSRDEPAGPLHRGVARQAPRGAGRRPAVDVRGDHGAHPERRLRVEEGQRAGAELHRLRGGDAARAPLPRPRRLRLHGADGGRPRRHRRRLGRVDPVAHPLLLRRRGGAGPQADGDREHR